MRDSRVGKLIFLPASSEFAPACRQHVLHPLRLTAVGFRDDESSGCSKHVYWRSVDLSRLAPHVRENAKPRQPTRKQAGDPIRESNVNLRQPSLAKAHHEST